MKTNYAIAHHQDGRVARLAPHSGRKFTLGELQAAVGGDIEIAGTVDLDQQPFYILVDEEGLLRGRPRNPHFPHFVGSVVLCPVGLMD